MMLQAYALHLVFYRLLLSLIFSTNMPWLSLFIAWGARWFAVFGHERQLGRSFAC